MDVSLDLIRRLLDIFPEVLVIANPDRTIAHLNERCREVFGYEPEEILGKKTVVLYESEQEYLKQGMRRFNTSEEEHLEPYTINYRRKNGEVFPGETIGTVLRNDDGEVMAFIGIIRDVTNETQALEELGRYRMETKRRLRAEVAALSTVRVNADSRTFTVAR